MTCQPAQWLPYTLPLAHHWQTSKGTIKQRHGELFRLNDAAGRTGWGDCAPLPAFGIPPSAARDFAEECAQLDLYAKRQKMSLRQLLGGSLAANSLAVNGLGGTLCQLDLQTLEKLDSSGCQIIKLKVGTNDLTEELAALACLREMAPKNIQWRFDANQAWQPEAALKFIRACRGLTVDCLEEPLQQPSSTALRTLQAEADFPLAIDESIELLSSAFFTHPCVRRIVIKPARSGGLLAAMALGLRARQAGLEIVVTTALESACGVLACAQLAAALAPEQTHGLNSEGIFLNNTGALPLIKKGRMQLPEAFGLGFTPV